MFKNFRYPIKERDYDEKVEDIEINYIGKILEIKINRDLKSNVFVKKINKILNKNITNKIPFNLLIKDKNIKKQNIYMLEYNKKIIYQTDNVKPNEEYYCNR